MVGLAFNVMPPLTTVKNVFWSSSSNLAPHKSYPDFFFGWIQVRFLGFDPETVNLNGQICISPKVLFAILKTVPVNPPPPSTGFYLPWNKPLISPSGNMDERCFRKKKQGESLRGRKLPFFQRRFRSAKRRNKKLRREGRKMAHTLSFFLSF